MMISALLLFFFFQAAAPEPIQHEQAGIAAQQQGQLDTAIAEFKRATELDPQLASAFYDLGAAYMQKRAYAAAIQPLKRALELNPGLPRIHELLGYALLSQGYAAEAIPHFQAADVQDGLGIAQLEAGDLPDAITTLEAALVKRPNDPDLLYYLGRASGLFSQQINSTLLSSYPNSARGHESLGDNYRALNQSKAAEQEYLAAIHERPDLPGIHLALGDVYAASSQWEKAEDEFLTEAKTRPGDAEAAFRSGSALLQNGKVHEALQELEIADRLRPQMPETLYALGKAASLEGDSAKAERSWIQLLAIEKDTQLAAQTHFGLAGLYRKEGRVKDAEREMESFAALQAKTKQPQQ